MTHQRRLHVFLFSFLIGVLLFSNGGFAVATAATKTPTVATPSATITPAPTITPTPSVDTNAEPQAWLDAKINAEKFSTGGTLAIHFNTPMDTESTSNPLLAWPDVPGSSDWNETQTALIFTPAAALKGQSNYIFFLNPALRTRSGKALKNAPEWEILTSAGVKVSGINPSFGELDRRYDEISISFDQEMETSQVEGIISFEPAISFKLSWKSARRLQIQLEQPFDFGQRYRLTVHRGLLAKNGALLDEDFTGPYQQLPAQARVESITNREVTIAFNYSIDRQKTGLGFSVSPGLEGKWRWISDKQAAFKSEAPIPANQVYRIEYPGTAVDSNGFEFEPPALQFSGLPPMRLLEQEDGMQKSTYQEGYYYADIDLPEIQIQFGGTVVRPTAEKAFSISPAVPGVFRWETNPQGQDILVYVLDGLLSPGQQYTVQVDASVKDAQGKPVTVTSFQENFSVNEWAYLSTTFGQEGSNIQVVDVHGSRRIQVAADEKAIFSAYRFDLIDFANLYAKYYSSRRRQNIRNIPIPAQDKPVAVWSGVSERKAENDYFPTIETTLPIGMEPGLYILNMSEDGRLLDQLFVVVSRNTLVVKQSGREMQAWVTDNRGRPVPNAEIRVYNVKSEKIREGKSDENGLYRVPLQESDQPVLVSARLRSPDDVTLAGFSGTWESYEGYGGSSTSHLPKGEPSLVYIYTERPIYRPGQTVYFKAILRQDNDVKYEFPNPGTPVTVQVKDARKNTLQTLTLATNDFGSVHGEILIPNGAMLGDYTIELDGNGFSGHGQFRVEDYRKPDFQVTITSLQPEKQNRFVHGEEVRVQVNTAYYFGEPVAGAKLQAEILYVYPIETSITGKLTTDEQGNTVLSFKALYSGNYYYWRYTTKQRLRLQVSVDDGSHQKVVGLYYFDVYPSTDQVRMDTGGYYAQPNSPITVNISDVDLFGQPVAGRDLTLAVKRWDWTKYEIGDTSQSIPLQTDANGKASAQITLKAGYHELTLFGKDSLGNPIETSRWLYVFKDKNDWAQRQKDSHLAISIEKDSYKPYQKARLVIESTFSGPAWLTFERGSVINSKQIELTAPLTIIDTDIIPEHAPNVFITVNAWQPASESVGRYGYGDYFTTPADRYLRVARAYVEVDAGAKALDITIMPGQPVYKPGETVSALIQVKDVAGQPVVAELSLAVVDEAIFALARPWERDIFEAFYGPRALTVNSFDSMSPRRVIYPGDMGGGGDDSPLAPRTDFQDTAFWLPIIETDANGQASVQFTLPDNTTRWRLSVKAVTRRHQVGQAQTHIEVKKELFLRPVLPRILTQGDTATLTTFVHNYSDSAHEARVSLSAPGLELTSPQEQQITLQPGEVSAIGWQARVAVGAPIQIEFSLKTGNRLQDGVRLPLEVQPAIVREIQTQSGQFSGETVLGLNLPNVDRETSRVTLTLNRSLGGTLLNGLGFLTGYPYGCVEQVMSRALPNAVVAHAADELGLESELQAKLPTLIQASQVKLYGLQHGDGGWGWWYDDRSDAYQTAWVLFGLSVVNDSGYTVDVGVIERAAKWLKSNMGEDARIQAYALYSLSKAGHGEREKTIHLAQTDGSQLDTFSQAALALALHNLGEQEQARAMLELLSQDAIAQGDTVYWSQSSMDGQYRSQTMSSSLRATALALQAYVAIDPANALIPGMVRYLASQRKGLEGWGTTNETSYTILALTDYLVSQTKDQGETPYRVLLNDTLLAEGLLEVGQNSVNLEIPFSGLTDGANSLILETQDDALLYFDLSTQYYRLQAAPQARGEIKILRRYLDPKTNRVLDTLNAGQLVKVELTLNVPEHVSYLALEDYLPGGLEALNEGLNASLEPRFEWIYEYEIFFWQDYGYNYKEIRGDRVVFFFTSLTKGKHTYTYMARAITPGQFTILPAQAYAMYDLNTWGRSERGEIFIGK